MCQALCLVRTYFHYLLNSQSVNEEAEAELVKLLSNTNLVPFPSKASPFNRQVLLLACG